MNQRLRLSYYDQNEKFAPLLPCDGTTDRTIVSAIGSDWLLFHLDHVLEYEGQTYEWLLLRSRWHDHPIGGAEPTSVHIIPVREISNASDGRDLGASDVVAWGMIEAVEP